MASKPSGLRQGCAGRDSASGSITKISAAARSGSARSRLASPAADALLIVVTPSSAASEWVDRECLYAAQLGKPLLVALAADTLIPLHLINLQYCDLRRGDGMTKLVESLRGLAESASAYDSESLSVAPLESNFFPYLAQLPQGEMVELVARELHEWALEHADAVDFAGRRRPGIPCAD